MSLAAPLRIYLAENFQAEMFTKESDDPPAFSRWRDHHHRLWLAMQTAHAEYRRTSDIVNLMMADIASSGSARGGHDLEQARDEQRSAFETYIDSRLRFAELLQELGGQPPIHHPPSSLPFTWWVVMALVSALLGSAAAYLTPSRETDNLRSERDQLSADLQASRARVEGLARRMNVVERDLVQPRSQPERPAEKSKQPSLPKVRPHGTKTFTIRSNQAHQEFTVKVSNGFTRIGPLSLSFRRLDDKRGDFNLYYSVRGSPVRKLHLRVYQPFRIAPGDPGGSIELVVNRISADRVHGYISVPRPTKSASEPDFALRPRLAINRREMPTPCWTDFK